MLTDSLVGDETQITPRRTHRCGGHFHDWQDASRGSALRGRPASVRP
jgi:hypothetical protein